MNYLWIYFEMKDMILNNHHIIIRRIFLIWLFHANAGKWYLSKQLTKYCAFSSVSCWWGSCFITCVLCYLPIWVPPRYCKFKFLHILMKVIGQICHGEFFMHMSDSYPEKKEGSILISCTFIRRRLISLVFI